MLGLALFTQYWYWYPLSYCISLAVQPAALIGVDATLRAPKAFQASPVAGMHALPAPQVHRAGARLPPTCLPPMFLHALTRGRPPGNPQPAFAHMFALLPLSSASTACANSQVVCVLSDASPLAPPVPQVVSNCRPSQFAYPPPVKVEDKKDKAKVRVGGCGGEGGGGGLAGRSFGL